MVEPGREDDPRSMEELEREKLKADIALARTETCMARKREVVERRKLQLEATKVGIAGLVAGTGLVLALNTIGVIAVGD